MYDPLIDVFPGENSPYPASYWAEHSGKPPVCDGHLKGEVTVDVAIIGAGYTGLSCAYHLTKKHGIHAYVVEANQSAWGCSGRNAGFILGSSGRKPFAQMKTQWGESVMQEVYQEMQQGVDTVKDLIAQGIDCEQQSAGYIKVAHKPSKFTELVELATQQQEMFGTEVQVLSKQALREGYMDDRNAYGAIKYQTGFGVNPLKLAWGYHQLAREAGAKIFTGSPVIKWQKHPDGYHLLTSKGRIKARKVVIATNGYTPKNFHPLVDRKTLPVLSQIIVTEPLTQQQLAACNWLSSHVVMDTRALKYYYRKLPDNRILFGGRGAITGKSADDPYYAKRLLNVLKLSFPALRDISYQYAWSGWICMSYDDLPHIHQNVEQDVFYAMGYCGSGVAFSAQAGKRLAQKVAGQVMPDLPIFNQPLTTFPFSPLRRLGQWGYFQYGQVKDKYF